jgi:RNA polymerase sigma-70 factor (ECF subfamily)
VPEPEKTTEAIISELKHGQGLEDNFQLLFARYYDHIYRFFHRKGFLPEDCRDLTQDVFFSVYKSLGELRHETQFEIWLYRTATNMYLNEKVRQRAKKRTDLVIPLPNGVGELHIGVAQGAAAVADPAEAMIEQERREQLRQAVQELPTQMRRCVQLHLLREMSLQETAAVLGISVNTVKAHLHQARKILNEKLSAYYGEVEL